MREIMNLLTEADGGRVTAYHGTGRGFASFRFLKRIDHPSRIGVWFASTPEAATHFAKNLSAGEKPRLITVSLNLGNCKVYGDYSDYLADWRRYDGDTAKMLRYLKGRHGFNSIQITRSDTDRAGDRTDWAVFEPWQIEVLKSEPLT
jgi:hypothetical protein